MSHTTTPYLADRILQSRTFTPSHQPTSVLAYVHGQNRAALINKTRNHGINSERKGSFGPALFWRGSR